MTTQATQTAQRPSHCLGIDPGNFGAFALLNLSTRKIHAIWDMPLKGGKIHPEGVTMIVDLAKSISSAKLVAAIENVNARPRQAGTWAFAFGVGLVHGCLASQGVPIHLIAPAQWKSAYGLRRATDEAQASTKTRARGIASRLWPESAELFTRVKDADRAEASLIGRFWASKNEGGAEK